MENQSCGDHPSDDNNPLNCPECRRRMAALNARFSRCLSVLKMLPSRPAVPPPNMGRSLFADFSAPDPRVINSNAAAPNSSAPPQPQDSQRAPTQAQSACSVSERRRPRAPSTASVSSLDSNTSSVLRPRDRVKSCRGALNFSHLASHEDRRRGNQVMPKYACRDSTRYPAGTQVWVRGEIKGSYARYMPGHVAEIAHHCPRVYVNIIIAGSLYAVRWGQVYLPIAPPEPSFARPSRNVELRRLELPESRAPSALPSASP